jgi:hypothetical protein
MRITKNLLSAAVAVFIAATPLQAAQITGGITFAGGAQFDTGSADTATAVVSWLNEAGNPPTVVSTTLDFNIVPIGSPVSLFAPWSFNSGPVPNFWTAGGFTFDLTSSAIVVQGSGFAVVSGTGILSGHGFDPTPGVWQFTTQNPSAGGVFTFSASTAAQPCTGQIGDFVWFDANRNGIQDLGEPGINGVRVVLTDAN